jgi:predicted exporter
LTRLKFNADVLEVLPAANSAVQGLKLHQRYFANARESFIVLKAANGAAGEAAASSLAKDLRQQTNLSESVFWQPPWQESPVQMAALIAHAWRNQPPEVFAQLRARFTPASMEQAFTDARERLATSLSPQEIATAGYDPLDLAAILRTPGADAAGGLTGGEAFGSADGTLRMISVKARSRLSGYRDCVQWMADLKQAVARWREREKPPGIVSLRYTGRPAFMAEIGGGMENDLAGPSAGTLVVIAVLFYFTHRRWLPMLWLIVLLLAILAGTLALGGLILSSINVVSLGFAAVLMGLAEDFGIVLYQESRAHPELSLAEIQRHARPGIYWSALTTSSAFLLLNFSGVPGLGQLGTLVAIGIFLSAVLMLYAYLPPLMRFVPVTKGSPQPAGASEKRWPTGRMETQKAQAGTVFSFFLRFLRLLAAIPVFLKSAFKSQILNSKSPSASQECRTAIAEDSGGKVMVGPDLTALSGQEWWNRDKVAVGSTAVMILAALGLVLFSSLPRFNQSAEALRPKNSQAYAALDELKLALGQTREPLWVVVQGNSPAEVAARGQVVLGQLSRLASNQVVAGYSLPLALLPQPENQQRNLTHVFPVPAALRQIAVAHGFTTNAVVLTEAVMRQLGADPAGMKLENTPAARWVLDQFVAGQGTNCLLLGLVRPTVGAAEVTTQWKDLPPSVYLCSWELLGTTVAQAVLSKLKWLLLAVGGVVLLTLWLALRRLKDVALSLMTMVAGLILLLCCMRLAGWEWNLMNLMALPLLLGMGVDFSLHMLLALQRYQGDLTQVHAVVGRALLLAGATTVAGFASLCFSSNAGLASLGAVCAVGIVCCQLTAIYLLPFWWKWTNRHALHLVAADVSRL